MENELATVLKYVGLSEKDASNLAVSYAKSNIFQLYEWQKDCIRSTNVNQGLNLVYCAPTGGGKTMVAEFIIFRSVCGLNKKAIFVLPFVSLVVEKVDYFKKLLRSYNSKCISDYDKVQVCGLYGDQSIRSVLAKLHRKNKSRTSRVIFVCTIEKANSLFNAFLSSNDIRDEERNSKSFTNSGILSLGCVVIDEMHMMGDATRGFLLEILVSKIQYIEEKSRTYVSNLRRKGVGLDQYAYAPLHIQLIGLSATVGNLQAISEWFGCNNTTRHAPYVSHFRPIQLVEYIVDVSDICIPIKNTAKLVSNRDSAIGVVCSTDNTVVRMLHAVSFELLNVFTPEEYAIVHLAMECVHTESQQALVFCGTRFHCQATCQSVVKYYSNILTLYEKGQMQTAGPLNGNRNLTKVTFESRVRLIDDLLKDMFVASKYELKSSVTGKGPYDELLIEYAELCAVLLAEFDFFSESDSCKQCASILRSLSCVAEFISNLNNATSGFSLSDLQVTLLVGIIYGVAFHHAGLNVYHRSLVESGYKTGSISILVATSTLAAGVNLPANRVVIRSIIVGKDTLLAIGQYKQMCGRAGRVGHCKPKQDAKSVVAESYVVVDSKGSRVGSKASGSKPFSKEYALHLCNSPLPPIVSQLSPNPQEVLQQATTTFPAAVSLTSPVDHSKSTAAKRGLLKLLLELFSLELCRNVEDVVCYVRCTLMHWELSKLVDSNVDASSQADVLRYVMHYLLYLVKIGAISITNGMDVGGDSSLLAIVSMDGHNGLDVGMGSVLSYECISSGKYEWRRHLDGSGNDDFESVVLDCVDASQLKEFSSGTQCRTHSTSPQNSLLLTCCLDQCSGGMRIFSTLSTTRNLSVTRFGRAIMQSGLNPDESLLIYEDLLMTQSGINLENNLHLAYLITSNDNSHDITPNFKDLWKWYDKPGASNLKSIMQAIGIDEALLFKWSFNPPISASKVINQSMDILRDIHLQQANSKYYQSSTTDGKDSKQLKPLQSGMYSLSEYEWKMMARCRRFWCAHIINALLESPEQLTTIVRVYGVSSVEDVLCLFASSKSLICKVQRLCGELGWTAVESLLVKYYETVSEICKLYPVLGGQMDNSLDKKKVPKKASLSVYSSALVRKRATDSACVAELLNIPLMTVKLAKLLVQNYVYTVFDVAHIDIGDEYNSHLSNLYASHTKVTQIMVLNWIRLNVAFDPQQELQVPVWELKSKSNNASSADVHDGRAHRLSAWVNEIVQRARELLQTIEDREKNAGSESNSIMDALNDNDASQSNGIMIGQDTDAILDFDTSIDIEDEVLMMLVHGGNEPDVDELLSNVLPVPGAEAEDGGGASMVGVKFVDDLNESLLNDTTYSYENGSDKDGELDIVEGMQTYAIPSTVWDGADENTSGTNEFRYVHRIERPTKVEDAGENLNSPSLNTQPTYCRSKMNPPGASLFPNSLSNSDSVSLTEVKPKRESTNSTASGRVSIARSEITDEMLVDIMGDALNGKLSASVGSSCYSNEQIEAEIGAENLLADVDTSVLSDGVLPSQTEHSQSSQLSQHSITEEMWMEFCREHSEFQREQWVTAGNSASKMKDNILDSRDATVPVSISKQNNNSVCAAISSNHDSIPDEVWSQFIKENEGLFSPLEDAKISAENETCRVYERKEDGCSSPPLKIMKFGPGRFADPSFEHNEVSEVGIDDSQTTLGEPVPNQSLKNSMNVSEDGVDDSQTTLGDPELNQSPDNSMDGVHAHDDTTGNVKPVQNSKAVSSVHPTSSESLSDSALIDMMERYEEAHVPKTIIAAVDTKVEVEGIDCSHPSTSATAEDEEDDALNMAMLVDSSTSSEAPFESGADMETAYLLNCDNLFEFDFDAIMPNSPYSHENSTMDGVVGVVDDELDARHGDEKLMVRRAILDHLMPSQADGASNSLLSAESMYASDVVGMDGIIDDCDVDDEINKSISNIIIESQLKELEDLEGAEEEALTRERNMLEPSCLYCGSDNIPNITSTPSAHTSHRHSKYNRRSHSPDGAQALPLMPYTPKTPVKSNSLPADVSCWTGGAIGIPRGKYLYLHDSTTKKSNADESVSSVNLSGMKESRADSMNTAKLLPSCASTFPHPKMIKSSQQLVDDDRDGNPEAVDVPCVADFIAYPKFNPYKNLCLMEHLLEFWNLFEGKGASENQDSYGSNVSISFVLHYRRMPLADCMLKSTTFNSTDNSIPHEVFDLLKVKSAWHRLLVWRSSSKKCDAPPVFRSDAEFYQYCLQDTLLDSTKLSDSTCTSNINNFTVRNRDHISDIISGISFFIKNEDVVDDEEYTDQVRASAGKVRRGKVASVDTFYMALPVPLPVYAHWMPAATDSLLSTDNSSKVQRACMLPLKCMVLISRYVGFEGLITNSPYMGVLLKQRTPCSDSGENLNLKIVQSGKYIQNPLLSVSRKWCVAARIGLQMEWEMGNSFEWRFLEYVLGTSSNSTERNIHRSCETNTSISRSPIYTKTLLSANLKHHLVGLSDRGLSFDPSVSTGENEIVLKLCDPVIANALLLKSTNVDYLKSYIHAALSDAVTHAGNCAPFSASSGTGDCGLRNTIQCNCNKAYINYIISKYLTNALIHFGLYRLYEEIEMPLLFCVLSAEYSGIPVNISYYYAFRQDIMDRQYMLQYYIEKFIKLLDGESMLETPPDAVAENCEKNSTVNLESPMDINLLKKRIFERHKKRFSVYFNACSTGFCIGKTGILNKHMYDKESELKQLGHPSHAHVSLKEIEESSTLFHPVFLMIHEFRSLSIALRACNSTISGSYKVIPHQWSEVEKKAELKSNLEASLAPYHRIRPVYNTLGTDTGRVIVTAPPMQQMPHDLLVDMAVIVDPYNRSAHGQQEHGQQNTNDVCSSNDMLVTATPVVMGGFPLPLRHSIHDELILSQKEFGSIKPLLDQMGCFEDRSRVEAVGSVMRITGSEWVRILRPEHFHSRGSCRPLDSANTAFMVGQLKCIYINRSLNAPFVLKGGDMLEILELHEDGISPTATVREFYRLCYGFDYDDVTAATVVQVEILVHDTSRMIVPADIAFRMYSRGKSVLKPEKKIMLQLHLADMGIWHDSGWTCPSTSLPSDLDFTTSDCLRQSNATNDCKFAIKCQPRSGIETLSSTKFRYDTKPGAIALKDSAADTYLISADYSQIELRLIAHLSGDKALCDALGGKIITESDLDNLGDILESTPDVFRCIAMKWKHKTTLEDVTDKERKQVKQLCYAILYGAGINTLATQLNVCLQDAKQMLTEFLQAYPGVQNYMQEIVESCRKLEFVRTILGRRRYLPNINAGSSKWKSRVGKNSNARLGKSSTDTTRLRRQAERQAVNTVMQGSAADLIKLAMVNIHHQLTLLNQQHRVNDEKPKPQPGSGICEHANAGNGKLKAHLVMQIHDELIYEVNRSHIQEVVHIIRYCMENAILLLNPVTVDPHMGAMESKKHPNQTLKSNEIKYLYVPLAVKIGIGKNWEELVAYNPENIINS